MQSPQSTTAWTQLVALGTRQVFRKHTFLYDAAQPAATLFLLQSGQVSLQLMSPHGRALTLQVVEPGQIFGHMALIADAQYDSGAEATRQSEVIRIGRDQVQQLMLSQPDLAFDLLTELAQHRLTVSQRLDEVAFKPVPARLASILLHMADSGTAAPARLPRRTHQQLAEMINAYRETVTKVINQFRSARLLDVDRSGITLLNPKRLREISDNSAF